MVESVEQLKSKASVLPTADRAELAHFLLSTLEPEELGHAEAWREEIERRSAEIDSGKAVGRPVEDVLAELREQYP